jgi:hypothetical protein
MCKPGTVTDSPNSGDKAVFDFLSVFPVAFEFLLQDFFFVADSCDDDKDK